jgi:hypothetical protein
MNEFNIDNTNTMFELTSKAWEVPQQIAAYETFDNKQTHHIPHHPH